MIREVMGFIHASKITTIITAKDRHTGQVVYQEEFGNIGFITSQYATIDERITYLDKKYPNLEWEYESWKD